MKSDCAFRMGKTHTVCEDYAVAGEETGYGYVLLADGCSSSPDTDIGARLLVKAAERELRCLFTGLSTEGSQAPAEIDLRVREPGERKSGEEEEDLWEAYHRRTLMKAREVVGHLGLPGRCLDATLISAISDGRRWSVAMVGDGVLVVKGQDQAIKVTSVSYAANCPEYLNYREDPERSATFVALKGNAREIKHLQMGPEGTWEVEASVREEKRLWTGVVAETEWIAVMSDGVHSFAALERSSTSRLTAPVPLEEILHGLTAFKVGTGQFAQRRMQRFLGQAADRGWQHNDDLAMGVILF